MRRNRLVLLKKYLLVAMIMVGVLVLSTAGFAYRRIQTNQRVDTVMTGKVIKDERLVVRAKTGIGPGEAVDITKYETVSVPSKLIPANAVYSISELKNKRIKNSLSEREIVLTSDIMPINAWYEDGDRLVEHNFNEGAIPASVKEGSLIDIKLFKQGAEDCIVISKTAVVSRNANLLSFYLNSAEQENIKEASTEGVLFAVEYIDTSQSPSDISYIPRYKTRGTSIQN